MTEHRQQKLRTHFYSVAIQTGRARKKDFTAATEKVMTAISTYAQEQGVADQVTLKKDDEALTRLGIFFMNAPERFAEAVKGMEGVKSVEKPKPRNKDTAKKSRRAAK